jgi:hypothetical protein
MFLYGGSPTAMHYGRCTCSGCGWAHLVEPWRAPVVAVHCAIFVHGVRLVQLHAQLVAVHQRHVVPAGRCSQPLGHC